MHNFEDYVRKEILNLITRQRPHIVSARTVQAKSIVQETPYVMSHRKIDNSIWKTYSRERPIIPVNPHKPSETNKDASGKGLNRSKSAFYRNLLKAENTLNEKKHTQRLSQQTRKRKDTQATNSTHRRQCLDSHIQARKIQNLVNLQLLKRQSSGASDNYLKAKLQFSRRRHTSTSEVLKIIKI